MQESDAFAGKEAAAPIAAETNRLYSILMDSRSQAAPESTFDIAEKIVENEKENAKIALERLWALKNNMQVGSDSGAIDAIIQYYQGKIDKLRDKEERIRLTSRDSRGILGEKKKADDEIASVKKEVETCNRDLEQLNTKLANARALEQQLERLSSKLKGDLETNENAIVTGLFDIIMTPNRETVVPAGASAVPARQEVNPSPSRQLPERPAVEAAGQDVVDIESTMEVSLPASEEQSLDLVGEKLPGDFRALYQLVDKKGSDAFPKSVVKTTGGVVVGEYFYDPKVHKNKRTYVFNSLFFGEQLALRLQALKRDHDVRIHTETVQLVADAVKRISDNPAMAFEVATNEIVNARNLAEVELQLRERDFDDPLRFCGRLHAKIQALGLNYRVMLREQIDRCSAN